MPDRFQHLRITRSEPVHPRRQRRGFGTRLPDDLAGHGRALSVELEAHTAPPAAEVPGFDPRRLLKVTLEKLQPGELETIPGISVVAEEGESATILFVTEEALAEFRTRLQQLASGGSPTRKDILYAIKHFDSVQPEDRVGPAMRVEGRPTTSTFKLDVELWPLDLSTDRRAMTANFREWCRDNGVGIVDTVENSAIVLLRLNLTPETLELVLQMRDVRQVDLPPRFQFDFTYLNVDVGSLGEISAPPSGAPGVVVLDSGIASNHPLLAPAIGDAQGFTDPESPAHDATGHGTSVAGLALYGDLEAAAQSRTFVPELWIFSGRVADTADDEDSELVENRVTRAVKYFAENYKCKVFNLSFGDIRRPYRGGHVGRFATTLDVIAREQKVLFVVSAGNFKGTEHVPANWKTEFPEYLLNEEARVIDPAPALNVLTVGSLARREVSRMAARYEDDVAYQPIARADEPSPFSRSGPTVKSAIKPDVVEYGGNWFVDSRTQQRSSGVDLGELTTHRDFIGGRVLTLDVGTSFSAAKVSHLAGRILAEYPDASPSLLRALIAAHAEVPEAAGDRLGNDREKILNLVGYGRPRPELTEYSNERCVTMIAEESLLPDQHHYYEIPLPEDFTASPTRRDRRITVALAYTPAVRRTRMEYRACKVAFRIVRAADLNEVTAVFRRQDPNDPEPNIPESGFTPPYTIRSRGTVQRATRQLRQADSRLRVKPHYVVVTHQPAPWAPQGDAEPYSLVVVLEDRSEHEVQLYAQIRAMLEARVRARV